MTITCPCCLVENSDEATQFHSCGETLVISYHLPPGSLLQQGKYKIEKVLGEGGFGITYKSVDTIHNRPVAIKENWPENATRKGTTVVWSTAITPKSKKWQLTKVATEAKFIQKCVHPNIVKVYDWFEENDTAYVVMSFISGKTLLGILETERVLTPARAKRYFLQIADTLQVIHGVNLLHRDIKPENIVINEQDQAVLIDFGATKEFIAGHTHLEQYSYRAKRYLATDIYALCASMYELLTGELSTAAAERALGNSLIAPRQLIPHLNPQLEEIILKGMKMLLNSHFQTVEELLQALLEGEQVAKLIPVRPQGSMAKFSLKKNRLVVGRCEPGEKPVDINLNDFHSANTVSRQHTGIHQKGEQWNVQDLGSFKGTFIKLVEKRHFYKLTVPTSLNSGDEISFGKIHLRFEMDRTLLINLSHA